MATDAGPYPCSTRDDTYEAIVGYLAGVGFYFRVLDADGQEVDGGGLSNELPHLVQLVDCSIYCLKWETEQGLVDALRAHDPAFQAKNPHALELVLHAA